MNSCDDKKVTVICYVNRNSGFSKDTIESYFKRVIFIDDTFTQEGYIQLLNTCRDDLILLMDADRIEGDLAKNILNQYQKNNLYQQVGYTTCRKERLLMGYIQNSWVTDKKIIYSPLLIAPAEIFLKAYAAEDLGKGILPAVGYSLQKDKRVKFLKLFNREVRDTTDSHHKSFSFFLSYTFKIPFRYLFSGQYFKELLHPTGHVQKDMTYRMLVFLLLCLTFVLMPYVSKDFGISGDEIVDHRHAGYVLDYFSKGDKAALDQPRTALHLYGISVQVIAAAICDWFQIDNFYEMRHIIGALIGALGIWIVALFGLRWGGGLCGLISLLLMWFTPRFFGHSMNNLKDVPFAVGYIISVYYTIRLFDYYPRFRLKEIVGAILGIALALGTRSGGLILYPMLLMYAGLFYIKLHGITGFYKFGKHIKDVSRIVEVLLIVLVGSYFLSILLWPFALQKPLSNVVLSLERFTHYNIGLKTIFEGRQVMSNMLPWQYAPKYLLIGVPLVTVLGFLLYVPYSFVRKKEFSLISYFLLFAAIFPVFWVVYKHSNLYGGIRHLLFVMPPMAIIAARFWAQIIQFSRLYLRIVFTIIFLGLFALPVIHYVKNHPNEYVYFNEIAGGLQGAYGDYETDYYFNSLKESCDWFKENIQLPAGKKTTIVTQFPDAVSYYFRKDTNIRVIYSRYYEKYIKDWDYAIFGNVYIERFQLLNHLFPPRGTLYTPTVDGFPMSFVLKRQTKEDYQGVILEKEGKLEEAAHTFREYLRRYPENEEIWSHLGKLYGKTHQYDKARQCLDRALKLHPTLNEALYFSVLVDIELKDYKAAYEAVEKMLSVNIVSVDAYYQRANIHYHLKKYKEALADLNRTLAYRSRYDRAYALAGDIFKDNGDYKQAEKMYTKALELRKDLNTYIALADVYCRVGNYSLCLEMLENVAAQHPTHREVHKIRARMALMQEKTKECSKILSAFEEVQDDASLFILRGRYKLAVHQKTEASQMFKKALELDPGNLEAIQLMRKNGLNE